MKKLICVLSFFACVMASAHGGIIRLSDISSVVGGNKVIVKAGSIYGSKGKKYHRVLLSTGQANKNLVQDCLNYLKIAKKSYENLQVVLSFSKNKKDRHSVFLRFEDVSSCALRYTGNVTGQSSGKVKLGISLDGVRMLRTFQSGSYAVQAKNVSLRLGKERELSLQNWQVVLQKQTRTSGCYKKSLEAFKFKKSFKVHAKIKRNDLKNKIKTIVAPTASVQSCANW